jgi:ABC-2 type transport system ATP-binding protein
LDTFLNKLDHVGRHYANGDLHLGFRQLTDCILDTKSTDLYRTWIAYTEWLESDKHTDEVIVEKALQIIEQLRTVEVIAATDKTPLLSAEKLSKTYGRGKFRLGAISMTIHPGDVWGLVGENGNGKTTLLRILAKDLGYDTGTLSFHVDEQELSGFDLRTRLTYIPQRTPKWYGSLKNNLKFTATHYGIKGEENELLVLMMIIRFGLWQYRHHQWSELSSGYKMRFELARTFLRAPRILLLDEPLANLDVLAQQLILEDLKSLSQSISNPIGIVLSSQQLFEVEKVSDKVLFLKKGVPTHLSDANEQGQQTVSVIEFDVQASREVLQRALDELLPAYELSFNGGMYIITIQAAGQMSVLLGLLIKHGIAITYVRDISQSTRRLFI